MAFTQNDRIATVASPLGRDVLLLERLRGSERISGLFSYHLDLASEQGAIDFKAIIGRPLTVTMKLQGGTERHLNGIVSRFSQGRSDARFVYYQAEIVPWTWLLTRSASCRIFQEMTVPDIVKKVFADHRQTDVVDKLAGTYAPRTYCVQYRETDYNFVCRLMEESGIAFYFSHDAKRHDLVIFDAPAANPKCWAQPEATCIDAPGTPRPGCVFEWRTSRVLGPGAYSLTDYDFEKPGLSLGVTAGTNDPIGGNERYEIYDHPGEYREISSGEKLAQIRMEAEECAAVSVAGSSDCAGFSPGTHFALTGHHRADANTDYLLTQVTHALDQSLVGLDGGPSTYRNAFACIPYAVPFRSRQTTPKPLIQGVQTAVVVGPAGEEIYVDQHARVKVQFHWDREGKSDENSSCWIRVSQSQAGKGFGGISTPRIDDEVVVSFVEGDPDRPIITGRVYNAAMPPPFALPAGARLSGFKSRSTKGGGGYNQISMDDTKGREGLTVHAQRDMDTTVEHDQSEVVHRNRTATVDVDEALSVGGNRTITVSGNDVVSISGSGTVSTGGTLTLTAGGSTIVIGASGITISSGGVVSITGAKVNISESG